MPRLHPPTQVVKAPASLNALRHGLLTRDVVTPRERFEDWDEFREAIAHALQPANAIELALADRVATLLWRLRRVAPAESESVRKEAEDEAAKEEVRAEKAGITVRGLNPQNNPYYDMHRRNAEPRPIEPHLLPDLATLVTISRYEAHLNRQLVTTLHELEALQERRAGRPAPLARVDVQTAEKHENYETNPVIESKSVPAGLIGRTDPEP